jgi:hypothetical protein
MDVWLQTAGTARNDSGRPRIARSAQQATAMTQNSAREAMQRAKRDFPEYTWEMESGFNSGEFLVHGRSPEKSRNTGPVIPAKGASDAVRRQIDELRAEAARLLAESEKSKRAAEKLAEKISRLEKTTL